jgi:hypothetical protein
LSACAGCAFQIFVRTVEQALSLAHDSEITLQYGPVVEILKAMIAHPVAGESDELGFGPIM